MGIRGTGNETLISGGDVEDMEVREDGLGDCQDQGEDPDESCSQDNTGSCAGCLYIQGLHNGPVPGYRYLISSNWRACSSVS